MATATCVCWLAALVALPELQGALPDTAPRGRLLYGLPFPLSFACVRAPAEAEQAESVHGAVLGPESAGVHAAVGWEYWEKK